MNNWNTIDELRQIFIDNYTNSKLSTILEKACSEEYELMRDYNGRQVLELLQNVDDACTDNKSIVEIKYSNHILEIGNTGTTFNKDTIERLCLGRSSNKSSSNIGNKGTGFRSLLNDAEWIEIHSGDFSIRFSYDFSKNLFDKYVDDKSNTYSELIATQLKNWKKEYPLCFPILNCPERIPKIESGFDTLIRIKIKDNNETKSTSIENQLNQPFYKSILFLPNITKIIIKINEETRIYEKIVNSKEMYDDVLIKDSNGSEEQFYLFKKQVVITNEKEAVLIIAYPTNPEYDILREKLYCYFTIRNFPTPIHALIHAPFITNSSRDDVPNDNEQINYLLFKEVAVFIKDVAELLKTIEKTNPIGFVTPINFSNNKMWDSDFFDLTEYYIDLLCNSKILPTVNNDFISINDNPKLIEQTYPNEFCGAGFEKLIKKNSSYDFIKKMCNKKNINYDFNAYELSDAINLHKDEYDITSNINVFIWWSKNFKNSDVLPKLLKDTSDNWIEKDSKVFLPTNDGISILDKELNWVRLCVVKQEYVSKLIEIIKKNNLYEWRIIENKYYSLHTNDKRLLYAYSDKYLAISFTEQSSSRVIISEMVNQINTIENSISFINWFFVNYKDKITSDSELAKLRFKLPDRDGNLQDTKKLYFGEEYGISLSEKLFKDTEYNAICELNKIYKGDEKENFIEFISICGVLRYPKCKEFSSDNIEDQENFKTFIQKKYLLLSSIYYIKVFSIDNFKKLLLELDTKEIVELLTQDLSLSSLIMSTEEHSCIKQYNNYRSMYFNSNEYVIYILNTTKWIELEGNRYSPEEIIKYGKLGKKLDFIYGIQERDLISLLNEDIVKRYGLRFKENFSDFSSKELYSIIERLPSFNSGEISRKLYIDIIKNKKGESPVNRPEEMLLLGKDGKYHMCNELVYVDKSIPQKIDNSKKLDIPIQQSTETIKNWFGVDRIKLNLELSYFDQIDNFIDFDDEFNDLKICILSILDDTENYVSKLKRMKVVPCYKIITVDNEQGCEITMSDYSFIANNGTFYYKVPQMEIVNMRYSHEYAMSFIEMFKEAVSSQIPLDLAELLISKNKKEKILKIEEKYGIDKWNNSYELLFEKSNISNLLEEYFKKEGLSNELLNKLKKIDFSSELSDEEINILFDCLKKVDRDICDLNKIHETIKIDVRKFIRKKCINFLSSVRNIYITNCYYKLKSSSNEQCKFVSMIKSFDNFDFSNNIKNSIVYSPIDFIKNEFLDFDDSVEIINVDEKYNNNYSYCINRDGVTKVDFDYFIEDNDEMKSLLYFDNNEFLINEFLKFKEKSESNIDKNDLLVGNAVIETKTINTELSSNFSGIKTNKIYHHNVEMGDKKQKELNEANDSAGRNAENIAYNELKKTYPNLIWNSKYSKNPADRNNQPPNNIVCDMWNRSNDGNLYFEIKSAVSEFEMSINEYISMKNNKNNYYVVLVNREEKTISMHLFEELDTLKEPSKYKFIFNQKVKK